MPSPKKTSTVSTIADDILAIEKMNLNLDKRLAKDAASYVKKVDSATKKLKKLSDTKAKAVSKKKDIAAKNKVKTTAALKKQLVTATANIAKANEALTLVKEEIAQLKIESLKVSNLVKNRKNEANMIAKFRRDEEKKAAQKLKMKSKAKTKVSKKKTVKPVVSIETTSPEVDLNTSK